MTRPVASSTQQPAAAALSTRDGLVRGLSPIGNMVTPPRQIITPAKDSPQWTDDELFNDVSFLRATQDAPADVEQPRSARQQLQTRRQQAETLASPIFDKSRSRLQKPKNVPPENLCSTPGRANATAAAQPGRNMCVTRSVSKRATEPAVQEPAVQEPAAQGDCPEDSVLATSAILAALDSWESEAAGQNVSPVHAPTLKIKSQASGG